MNGRTCSSPQMIRPFIMISSMMTMELSAGSGRLSAYGPRNDKRWIPAFAGMTEIEGKIGAATRKGKVGTNSC
jgi:hypothetical protein